MTSFFPRLGPPADASLDGHRIDDALRMTTALVGSCLAIVLVALAYLLWRYRRSRSPQAVPRTGDTRAHAALALAVAAVMIGFVDIPLARIAHADLLAHVWNPPTDPRALRVEIQPQQFAWNIRYAGADGRFDTPDDVLTLNDLRVPVHVPVIVQLRAKDVIHSFFVPAFRVKQDAIPGRVTRTWFQAERLGTFEIACAQLCGVSHYRMRGELTVLAPSDFARWLGAVARDSAQLYAAGDLEAHWGWSWRD